MSIDPCADKIFTLRKELCSALRELTLKEEQIKLLKLRVKVLEEEMRREDSMASPLRDCMK